MYTRAKKILASEMMYALEKTEEEAEAYLDDLLQRSDQQLAAAAGYAPRLGDGGRAPRGRRNGERLGAGRPKAFVVLAGRPMLEWSLEALRAAGSTTWSSRRRPMWQPRGSGRT